MLVAMTFRTPDEAIALANNTRYGLAASVWTENVNRALEVAAKIKAGVVWINSTNLFDAASGFGGYRESGFGREGGREGLAEYLVAPAAPAKPAKAVKAAAERRCPAARRRPTAIGDRPHRQALYRRQAGAARFRLLLRRARPRGPVVGLAGLGNRKDIRNAVEAAAKAGGWGAATAHNRAQVLYYVAENLESRGRASSPSGSAPMTGAAAREARAEVEAAVRRAVLLRRLRRQVRRRGARDQDALRHAGDERAVGRDGDRLPRRGAAARLRLAGHAGDRDGQCASSSSPRRAHPLSATDFYSRARHLRRAGRRRQHRHRRGGRRSPRRSPSTTASTRSGTSAPRELAKRSKPPRPPISRRPGPACRRATGPTSRAATTCAARRKSRTSGRPTGSEAASAPPSFPGAKAR